MTPVMFIFVVGMGTALIRRRLVVAPADRPARGDLPAQLMAWTVGLFSAQRQEWGQAMVGELDHVDGRARRWRFALGCVGAAVVMPPWGRAAAALGALVAVAASAAGLTVYTYAHYRLHTDGWTWVGAAVLLLLLLGYVLGGSALLRRPGVAGPGLVGGLLVAAAWLAVGGFTFNRWLNSLWSHSWLLFLAPVVVGVAGTLWGGSATVGRRANRLAAVIAALSIYVYGVVAVAVVGAGGHDPSDGWTPAQIVDDSLGNQAVFYLIALPVMTVAVGWAAAAATARLRRSGPAVATTPPTVPAPGPGPAVFGAVMVAEPDAGATGEGPVPPIRRRRIGYIVVLVCAGLFVVALFALALLR